MHAVEAGCGGAATRRAGRQASLRFRHARTSWRYANSSEVNDMENRPKLILVVDDNEDVAHIAAAYLSKRGYGVVTATDGQRALALVAERRPDCILLDVMMPTMSGLQVLSRLKED